MRSLLSDLCPGVQAWVRGKALPNHVAFENAIEDAAANYQENNLAYHNIQHIQGMLTLLQEWSVQDLDLIRRAVLELAIVYHDIVYVPGRKDNESASAKLAREALSKLDGACDLIPLVESTIMSTANHINSDGSIQTSLIIDLDLHGLGTDSYWENGARIRSEFIQFSDEEYAEGRKRFLALYGTRDPLFLTEFGRRYEIKAKENMGEELRLLQTTS